LQAPVSFDQRAAADVDAWVASYNAGRTNSGKYCYGKTPAGKRIPGQFPEIVKKSLYAGRLCAY
jgi:hypothetical protein